MRSKFLLLALALGCLSLPIGVAAQSATLTGIVRSDTQTPIPGALVSIPTLNLTAVTNDNGQYRIIVPASQVSGQQVAMQVSSLGYSDTEVTVTLRPGPVTQNVTLATRAIALDEVIVTGTAGRKEARAQAATVATINTAKVREVAPVTTVANLLQARTPGLVIQNQSGSTGTAQTIRIRGISSITQGNEPLIFLDGIRVDGGSQQIYGTGGQAGSRLNDIKSEDIESIEVVKGPAAATLYGSDAVAGVINIITKKGRAGSGFTQTINMEYGRADPAFTPPDNWGVCSASALSRPTTYPNCVGKAEGTILHDNPLERTDAFLNGTYRNLNYNLRGGGENYGVFLSLGADDDQGTLPNNEYGHVNGRTNFDFFARPDLHIEAGFGIARVKTQLPRNDNDIYGYLGGGMLGDPRTLGGAKDGWYAPYRQISAISSYENVDKTWRIQPRAAVTYTPWDWFTNRVQVGADMVRTEAFSFWAKNDEGWWDNGPQNNGQIGETRRIQDRITLDYLGTVTHSLTDDLRLDLSVGSQAIANRTDNTSVTGQGLVNNEVRSVNAAAILLNGGQSSSQSRDIGVFSQAEFSWMERLYMQLGLRRDQSSTFGVDSKPFYSPKVGLSYVISDEDYFHSLIGFLPEGAISELRLRGAYGVSGRQPNSGARSTYSPSTNQISATEVAVGVRPGATGNPLLRAEKSKELELGFDAGIMNDRFGLNFTYYHRKGVDQILTQPVPPSLGTNGPQVNVGSILTSGVEAQAEARIITRPNFALEVRASANTMHNEVLDLGGVPETTTRKPGFPLNGAWEYAIKEVDVANNQVIVSDTLEYLGNGQAYPGWATTLSSTLTLWQSLTFYAQVDGQGDYSMFDNTNQFRDRSFGIGESSARGAAAFGTDAEGNPTDEAIKQYMMRYGPFVTESGTSVSRGSVDGAYRQTVHSFKLREASVSFRFPTRFVQQYVRARSASASLTMRNLHTWTNYLGFDPEASYSSGEEFLTVPQDKRWTLRFAITF